MGILDGIVAWIAEQVIHGLDLINTSVLGALGCDMAVAFEDAGCSLGRAHSKGHRRCVDQNTQQHITWPGLNKHIGFGRFGL